MITLIGVDPGTDKSAYVAMDGRRIVGFEKVHNQDLLVKLDFFRIESDPSTVLAVEMVSSYGMAVGAEVFETCVQVGRFIERWRGRYCLVRRHQVKTVICQNQRAKDSNIRAALIERYGGRAVAIGTKLFPGPLHGVADDVWSALAVATTYREVGSVATGSGVVPPVALVTVGQ